MKAMNSSPSSSTPAQHAQASGSPQHKYSAAPIFPVAKSVSTDHDPDHRSYTRHTESSESARPGLSNPLVKSKVSGTLSEMASFLSASSSLSGSTQHPCGEDDDDDDNDNDDNGGNDSISINSEDPNQHNLIHGSQSSSPSISQFSEKSSQSGFVTSSGVPAATLNNLSTETISTMSGDSRTASLKHSHIVPPTSINTINNNRTSSPIVSPVLQAQSREHMTTHQVVQHHAQQQHSRPANYTSSSSATASGSAGSAGSIFRSQSADPYAFLSRPRSSASNMSSGTTVSSTKRLRFKHYHKPKVTDSPRLVFLCQQFINTGDADSLAVIARRRGLPPKVRHLAWPLLLASHPYVLKPNLCVDSMSPPTGKDVIPTKRITNEILRYQKKRNQQKQAVAGTRSTLISSSNPSSATNTTVTSLHGTDSHQQQAGNANQDEIEALRCTVIQEAVENFLTKWGHIIPYDPGMVYVGFALSEWIELVPTNSSCSFSSPFSPASAEHVGSSAYPSAMASLAHSFAHLSYQSSISTRTSTVSESFESRPSSPALQAVSASAQRPHSPNQSSEHIEPGQQFSLKTLEAPSYTFSQVFYNFMMIVCHSPEDIEGEEAQERGSHGGSHGGSSTSKPSSIKSGGQSNSGKSTTTDRISFFLSAFRRLLPELADHFDEEDVLSGIGGDEWVLYWIKWLGAKVWDKRDRARIWDMHLGWRPNGMKLEDDEMFMKKVMKACQLGGVGGPEVASVNQSNLGASACTSPVAAEPVQLSDCSAGMSSSSTSPPSSVASFSSFTSNSGTGSNGAFSESQGCENGTGGTNNTNSSEFVVKTPTNQNFTFTWAQLENEIGPDPFWTAGSVLVGREGERESEREKAKAKRDSSCSSLGNGVDEDGDKEDNTVVNNFKKEQPTVRPFSTISSSSTSSLSSSFSSSSSLSCRAKCMDPLTEHLFVCLALLKSKTSTLLELDQSEIRGLLGKLYRSKDVESLVSEACEMWRTWDHEEESDEGDE